MCMGIAYTKSKRNTRTIDCSASQGAFRRGACDCHQGTGYEGNDGGIKMHCEGVAFFSIGYIDDLKEVGIIAKTTRSRKYG